MTARIVKHKQFRLFAGGGLVLCLLVTCYYLFWRPKTLKDVAMEVAQCMKNKDADCLANLEWGPNLEQQHLTRQSAAAVLKQYLFPEISQCDPGGLRLEVGIDDKGNAYIPCTNFKGKSIEFGFLVAKTSEGYRAPSLVEAAVYTVGSDRYFIDTGNSSGLAKLEAWRRMALKDGPMLSKLGMTGISRTSEEGFRTWEQFAQEIDTRQNRVKDMISRIGSRSGKP